MIDLAERARRVEIICNTLHGSVIGRDGAEMRVEIPADMASPAARMFGMGGFCAVITGQSARMEPRRVTTMQGHMVIDHAAQDLMAFYSFKVELTPHAARIETTPHAAAIAATRPVKPASASQSSGISNVQER
jgi:hypothetical protein